MSVFYSCTMLIVVMCFVNGTHTCEASGCLSIRSKLPITLKQPQDISECSSDSKFKTQIHHNYDIMLKSLEKMTCSCNQKDIDEFLQLLSEMKTKIIGIIDSYFGCDDKSNPIEAVNGAIESYDSIRKRFRSYGRNAFNKFSSKCNSVIQYIRRLPYISAENTIMSIASCAKLKTLKN